MGRSTGFSDVAGRLETLAFFRVELDIDVVREYRRLADIGRLPVNVYRDRVALMGAVNEAAHNAHVANRIAIKARRERAVFMVEYHSQLRALKKRALAGCAAWIQALGAKKQVTEGMIVEEMCHQKDLRAEYEPLERKREEWDGVVADCESLAKQWSDRKGLLQTQARLLQAQREVILGKPEV